MVKIGEIENFPQSSFLQAWCITRSRVCLIHYALNHELLVFATRRSIGGEKKALLVDVSNERADAEPNEAPGSETQQRLRDHD